MSREDIVRYQFTSEQSRSEAAENGRKGGIASGEARRRKRAAREAVDYFWSLPPEDPRLWNKLSLAGVDPEDIDNQMAVVAGLTAKAIKGDAKAAKVLIDLLGEDGKDDGGEVQIIDDL